MTQPPDSLTEFLRLHPEYRLLALSDLPEYQDDFTSGGIEFEPFSIGDANGDGRADIAAVVLPVAATTSYNVLVLHQLPDGSFGQLAWVVQNETAEKIIGVTIGDRVVVPLVCLNCDANSAARWTGTAYEFRIRLPGETACLVAGAQVRSEPTTNSRSLGQVKSTSPAEVLELGDKTPNGIRWHKIRVATAAGTLTGFIENTAFSDDEAGC